MNPWIFGYFLLGGVIYVALWLWSGSRGKETSADGFFFGAVDLLFIAIWPLALPFMIRDSLREQSNCGVQSGEDAIPDRMKGKRGTVVTDLRPSGKVEIDGERFQAVAAYGVLPRGSEIEVFDRDDLRLRVRGAEPATNQSAQESNEGNAGHGAA